jgi:hypothetical protein
MKKIASRAAKPAVEKGDRDHNLIGIWRRGIFILSRSPLKDGTGREEMLDVKFVHLALIDGGGPKHVRV